MNSEQIQAIKCAYLDLKGSLNAFHECDFHFHDWRAHQYTIDELETAFPFLTEETANVNSSETTRFDPWLAPEGFVAMPEEKTDYCDGCEFQHESNFSVCGVKRPCLDDERPDKTPVIFVPIESAVKMWLEQKRITDGVFLDGEPATAHKKPDGFWIVRKADGKGGDVEYSEAAVKYTLTHNKGRFVS